MDPLTLRALSSYTILDLINIFGENDSDGSTPLSDGGRNVSAALARMPNDSGVARVTLRTAGGIEGRRGILSVNVRNDPGEYTESSGGSSANRLPDDVPDSRKFCTFCKNNRETPSTWQSHILKDTDGNIRCPVLRAYTCPLCGGTGDDAHTQSHCFLADPRARSRARYLKRRTSTPSHRSNPKKGVS